MADGAIRIDVLLNTAGVVSDKQKVENMLKGMGVGAGDKMGNEFTKNTDKMDKGMSKVNFSTRSMVGSALKLTATLAGVGTFTNLVGKAIGRVDTIDTAVKSLTVLTGSSKEAKAVMDGLGRAIDGTPIALNQVALGAKKMVAAGMEGKKVEAVFQSIADAAYGVGDGAESIDQITNALSSMQSSGTVYSDDINRMVDAGVPAWKILANTTGQSVGEMKKAVSEGSLESEEAINMLVTGIENGTDGMAGSTARMGGLAKTAGNTISGEFGNMRTAAVKSLANIADNLKGPIIESLGGLKLAFKSFADYTASDEFQHGLTEFVSRLKEFIGFLSDHRETVMKFVKVLGYLAGAFLALKIINSVYSGVMRVKTVFTNTAASAVSFTQKLFGIQATSTRTTAQVNTLAASIDRLNAALVRNQSLSIGAGVKNTAAASTLPVTGTRVGRNAAKGLPQVSKGLGGAGKIAGKALPAGMILLSATELMGMTKDTAGEHVGSALGSAGGAWGGAAAGAALGSVVPGVGTAVGGLVGAGVGAIAGTKLGKEIGEWSQKKFEETFKPKADIEMGNTFEGLSKGIQKTTKKYEELMSAADMTYSKISSGATDTSRKSVKENEKTYESIEKLMKAHTDNSEKESKKSLQYLVDEGYLTKKEAEDKIKTLKETDKQRNKDVKYSLTELKDLEGKYAKEIAAINKEASEQKKKEKESFSSQVKRIDSNEKDELLKNLEDHKDKDGKLTQTGQLEKKRIQKKYIAIREEAELLHNEKLLEIDEDGAESRTTAAETYGKSRKEKEEKVRKNVVKTLSKSEKQQMIILGRLKDNVGELSEEQASKVIKESAKQRNKVIKDAESTHKKSVSAAEKKYKETVAVAEEQYHVTGTLSKKQYDEVIKNATSEKDDAIAKADEKKTGAVKHAEEMHTQVVKQAQDQAAGHADAVDTETGDVLSKWGAFLSGLATVTNGISDGINHVLEFFGMEKKIPQWVPKGYNSTTAKSTRKKALATGDSSNYSGTALVGEAGAELAYVPYSGEVRVLGANGPEFTHVASNEHILPADKTAKLLSGGSLGTGMVLPGYASGKKGMLEQAKDSVGDFISGVKKTGKKVVGVAKDVITDPIGYASKLFEDNFPETPYPVLKDLSTGFLDEFKKRTLSLLKKKESEQDGPVGDVSGAGVQRWKGTVAKALKMNGLPVNNAYINAWLRQIASESGGNPGAIQGNIGDVNNKSGDIAKGLVQVIGQTFNAYKHPGHNNRLNGLDSLLAGMNYAKATYGTKGMLGVIGHGHGYAVGTNGSSKGLHPLNEEGGELRFMQNGETVIPHDLSSKALKNALVSASNNDTLVKQASALIANAKATQPHMQSIGAYSLGSSATRNGKLSVDNSDIISAILDSKERPANVHVTLSTSEMSRLVSRSQGSTYINEGAFLGGTS